MHYRRGVVTRQAHVDLPEGTVEEEYGREGFFGRVAHLYRAEPPVNWTEIEGDCRPVAFVAEELPGLGGPYIKSRVPFLHNDDVVISMARLSEPMTDHFRNADGDEVLFVHRGAGRIETDFGPLDYRRGDYLVIPRGTVYRLKPVEETALLIVESAGEVALPDRGLMGKHALFDPDVITVPTPEAAPDEPGRTSWNLWIKRRNALTRVAYPNNPINVVGWKGDLTVWQLNIDDIRPVLSERYHLPPSAHATFIMPNAVICTFLPRGLETGDPNALRVPFYHANIDFDEVLFYHDGEFFSREGIDAGMVTFHPQGIHHGPQPGAVKAAADKTRTNEKAVMIDTRRPLELTPQAAAVQNPEYWKSWQG